MQMLLDAWAHNLINDFADDIATSFSHFLFIFRLIVICFTFVTFYQFQSPFALVIAIQERNGVKKATKFWTSVCPGQVPRICFAHICPQGLSWKCLFKQNPSGKCWSYTRLNCGIPIEMTYISLGGSVRYTRNNAGCSDLNLWHHRQLPVGCKQKARPLFALIRRNPCSNAERQ